MNNLKIYTVIILLISTALLSFAIPKQKYVGTDFISNLEIPMTLTKWQGKDISNQLNINTAESQFSFISDAMAIQYVNRDGQSLIFIVLDAGNFHHPKNCFISSGYSIKELPDSEFILSDRTVKVHTLFTERGGESFLSLYWIVINKNIAHEWVEQKFKQLYFSLFDQKRVGLMMRIDIPANANNIKDANAVAKDFLYDLSKSFLSSDSDYIFGEK